MRITLNGNDHPVPDDASILDLLASLGLSDRPVVVELNQTALFPRDYPSTILSGDDSVEIITIAAGG